MLVFAIMAGIYASNNRIRALAPEVVGLQPDIIVTSGTAATFALQRETRTVPIVFVALIDPVASGIVPQLNQPGGKHHRLCQQRIHAGRQVASAALGDRARPQAGRNHVQS